MGKTPGRSLYNRFHRKPIPHGRTAPETDKPAVHRKTEERPRADGASRTRHRAIPNAFSRLQTSIISIWHKIFPPKTVVPNRQCRSAVKRRCFALCIASAAVVTVVLLLVLLAPGGSAAPAAGTPSASGIASLSPAAVLTTAAETTGTPIPTTAPDEVATPTPTATAKATATPTATPKATPTVTPTATPTPTVDWNTLIAFYVVEADTYYDKVGYSSNHYEYTDEELTMLAKIIQAEAGGESDTGKIAVGNVVLNRVLSGQWGSTIDAVKGGFSYHEDTVPKQKSIDAAHAVLDDEVWVVPQNTYYFKTSGGEWRDFTFYGQIGNHYFYTREFSTRYNGDSIPDALYARIYKYAQYGCKASERVYRIQYMLKSLGYDVEKADKYFGTGTKAALIKFQQDHGLDTDGVAGPATLKALIRAFGVDAYCDKFS